MLYQGYMSNEQENEQEQPKKFLTLVFARRASQILLGMKKRGFGAGRWNGFGGKVKDGESVEDAARREFLEETGLAARELSKRGDLHFTFAGDPVALYVQVFEALSWDGEAKESEEMAPKWFFLTKIPYDAMWPDDKLWLPIFLAGKKFTGEFAFTDQNTMISHSVKEV